MMWFSSHHTIMISTVITHFHNTKHIMCVMSKRFLVVSNFFSLDEERSSMNEFKPVHDLFGTFMKFLWISLNLWNVNLFQNCPIIRNLSKLFLRKRIVYSCPEVHFSLNKFRLIDEVEEFDVIDQNDRKKLKTFMIQWCHIAQTFVSRLTRHRILSIQREETLSDEKSKEIKTYVERTKPSYLQCTSENWQLCHFSCFWDDYLII